MKIADKMKPNALLDQVLRLQAELASKQAMIAELRRQLELKVAYILGQLDANPDAAPTVEFLESIIWQ